MEERREGKRKTGISSEDDSSSGPRSYRKRKKQVGMPAKRRKKDMASGSTTSAQSSDTPAEAEDDGVQHDRAHEADVAVANPVLHDVYASAESNDADDDASASSVSSGSRNAKKYKKRKKLLNLPRKIRTHLQVSDDEEDLLEVGDGDDHAEYEYIHSGACTGSEEMHLSPPVDLLISSFVTETEAIDFLTSDLFKSMADTQYIVDCSENVCRLSMLGSTANVYVVKAVTWGKDQGLKVFVHNRCLPPDSVVYIQDELVNRDSIPATSDYLMRVANLLSIASVCSGITDYDHLWCEEVSKEIGVIEKEYFEGSDCFRSFQCKLTVFGDGMCQNCKKVKETFRKRVWKRMQAHSQGKSKKTVNNAIMSKQALLKKIEEQQKEKRKQRVIISRLRKRIAKQIQKDSVPIDSVLGQDFFKIMKANVKNMTDIQKLFWNEQVKALSRQKNPKSMRWSPMMIKIALHLQMLSPAAYNYWRDSGLVFLPSERRLYDFTHFTEAKEGIQDHIIEAVKKKVDPSNNPEEYFNLLFDEMTIRSDIVLNRKGEVIGCTNMTAVEESVANLESKLNEEKFQKDPAKKVLVYMLQKITNSEGDNSVHEIVAIFATGDLTAEHLYTRTWDVIYNCEASGLKILCLVCDGASCNKKFFRMNVPLDSSSKFSHSTKNIACGENRPLFFQIDPPHLLKTIRNCFANSYSHKFSRKMWKDGHIVSWEAIERLHDVSVTDKFVGHKLTRSHVKLTPFSRMNVKLATQVMSRSVARSLEAYEGDPRFFGLINPPLIEFIKIVNTLFDCLNGSNDPDGKRNKMNPNLLPFTSSTDKRLTETLKKCLAFFDDWYNDVQSREGSFTKDQREQMMISSESYESLHITVKGFIGSILYLLSRGVKSFDAKSNNQDKVEQYFGLLRMSGGANNNPNLPTVLQKCLSLSVQKTAALPSRKGNTSGKRETLRVNQDPLQVRKRKN